MAAKTKLTAYVNADYADEIQAEADRLERSVSWMLEHCWRVSRAQVRSYQAPGPARRNAA